MITYNMEDRKGRSKCDYLYSSLKRDIQEGKLKAGERLPSKRSLADHLGVSQITVETAYFQLIAEGYIFSRPRSGYYVSESDIIPANYNAKELSTPTLSGNSQAQECQSDFPFSILARIMRKVISDYSREILLKSPHSGCPELRNAISDHLIRYRGMRVDPDQIIVGSGAEYLYGLIAQYFGSDVVFGIENPSYEKISMVYGRHGIKYELLLIDQDGISSDQLKATSASILHVTPYHSFPSGITASPSKRREYLTWAAERNGYVIEDDFYSEFSLLRKPVETLFSMDKSDSVIYLNTFTKSIAPSMRMGYMVLPKHLIESYDKKLGFYSCTVPTFDQYVIAEFISQGYFERHLNRTRRKLRQESGAQI